MKNLIFLSILLSSFIIQSRSFAQGSFLKSSTFSVIGPNNSKTTTDLFIQQSIGQSSVIGSFRRGDLYFRQGFLTGFPKIQSLSKKSLSVLAFPNSFYKEVKFRFFPEFNQEVGIGIYDMSGEMVYENKIIPNNNVIWIDLDMLSSGLYIVVFNCENRLLQSRIIKL
jgi:hypothetical protein